MAMDEVVIEDKDLVRAIHEYHFFRDSTISAVKEERQALEVVTKLIPNDALAELIHNRKTLRIGPFLIAWQRGAESRNVMRISPPKE